MSGLNKIKPKNNYEIAYKSLLLRSAHGRNLLKEIDTKLKNYNLIDYQFLPDRTLHSISKEHNVSVKFKIFQKNKTYYLPYQQYTSFLDKLIYIKQNIISGLIFTHDDCDIIINNSISNIRLKLRKDIILKGGSINKKTKPRYQRSFYSWLVSYIFELKQDELMDYYDKIKEKMDLIISSKVFKKKLNEFIESNAIKKIQEVVERHKSLGKDVIKMAVSEYLIKSTMDID